MQAAEASGLRPPPPSFRIEQATEADLQAMIDRGNAEDWDQGRFDAALYFAVDSRGFWKSVCPETGDMLASVSGVCYDPVPGGEPFGFIGYYLTRPDLRGRGLGLPLFMHALRDLRARGCVTIGLDAVLAQETNYVKSGFTTRYRQVRYGLKAESPGRAACAAAAAGGAPASVRLVPWSALSFEDFAALDRSWFGAARPTILRGLMAYPGAVCLAACDAASGAILGYGALREAADDWRIGPLFAAPGHGAAAITLLHALVAAAPASATVVIDVPDTHAAAVSALRDGLGAVVEVELARMYTDGPPRGMVEDAVWGTTFLEIG